MEWFKHYEGAAPPGFEGNPWLYFVTVFSLLMVNLLSFEWMWRLGWSLAERPLEIRHPGSALRMCLLMLIVGGVIRSGPDLIWLIRWPDIGEAERSALLSFDGYMDSVSFIPFSIAWLIAWLGGPMIIYQLAIKPTPVHLWPSRQQFVRPLKIGVGVMAMSLALTFLG